MIQYSMTTKIKTIIWDLGAVLIDWNPRHLYRKLGKSDKEIEWLLANVMTSDWNHQMDAGKPFEIGVAELSEKLPEHREMIEAYWERWPEMITGPMKDTVEILNLLDGKGLPMYALTNWSDETIGFVNHYEFFKKFKGILVSGEEKLAKPDPEFFQLLFDRFQIEPTSSLFIDDNTANIETAKNMGVQSVPFQGAQHLKSTLIEIGLL